ncbi:hypothetical protein SESBI_04459 [Sesbania bispinosa]|nr:hypothetical protein SESBI_04459 [Sesbania bispinosa]
MQLESFVKKPLVSLRKSFVAERAKDANDSDKIMWTYGILYGLGLKVATLETKVNKWKSNRKTNCCRFCHAPGHNKKTCLVCRGEQKGN